MLASVARPERDRYSFNPADVIQKRDTLLGAAFTIMRAFRQAECRRTDCRGGCFYDWSRKVRDACMADPVRSGGRFTHKSEDPRRQDDSVGCRTTRRVRQHSLQKQRRTAVYSTVSASKRGTSVTATQRHALYDALERVLGSKWTQDISATGRVGSMEPTMEVPVGNAT